MKRLMVIAALLAGAGAAYAQEPELPAKGEAQKTHDFVKAIAPTNVTDDVDDEEPGIDGECHVDSRVNAYIRVYINGRYRGTIPPWGDIYPLVRDCHGVTDLYAETECGRWSWSRRVYGGCDNYHWVLRP